MKHTHQRYMNTITVDGIPLSYADKGEGQPVVCVHGNPGMGMDFMHQDTEGFRIIAFDRPGHGFSGRYKEKNGHLDVQVRTMRALIQALDLERPVIAGHSWGCYIALAYALAYPDDVKGLMLMGPVVYAKNGSGGAFGGLVKVMQAPLVGPLVTRLLAVLVGLSVDKKVAPLFEPDPMPGDYRETALPLFVRPLSFKSMLEDKVGFEATAGDVSQRYSEIKTKTLVIVGDSDTVAMDTEQQALFVRALPQSKVLVLPETGHQIPHMKPRLMKDHIAYFTDVEEPNHG